MVRKPPRGGFFLGEIWRMQYALGLGLLLLSFVQNFSALPWRSAHNEFFAFVAVLVLGGMYWRKGLTGTGLSFTPPVAVWVGLAMLISGQFVAGQIEFGGDAIVLLLYTALCAGGVLLGQVHAQDTRWSLALAVTLLVAAVLSALIALVQALMVDIASDWVVPLAGYRRTGANFGQSNHLATLQVMGAACLVYLHQQIKLSRLSMGLLGLVLLLGMGISESRTGLLSGMVFIAWWWMQSKALGAPVRLQWAGTAMVALLVAVLCWPIWISALHEVGGSRLNSNPLINTAIGARWLVWPQLAEAVAMKPWFGWGLRQVSVALTAVAGQHEASEPFSYAHNVVLDMALGMGVPLTVLVLLGIGYWGWTRIQSIGTPETWLAVAVLIPFAVHSTLEYPFAYAYFLVPTTFAVGLLEQSHNPVCRLQIPRTLFAACVVSFGALLTLVVIEYMEIEEDFRIARFESLRVGQTPLGYERPNTIMLTQLKALSDVIRTNPHPHMTSDELSLLRFAAARFLWAPVQNTYALAAALNGDTSEGQRQLMLIRVMHGESAYRLVAVQWAVLAQGSYPQLRGLAPP